MIDLSERSGARIIQYEIGDYQNFVYLVLDWEEKKAAIVDPQADLLFPLNFLKKYDFHLTDVLLTHTHFDHIAGLSTLIRTHPHLLVRVHRDELHRLPDPVMNTAQIKLVQEGHILHIGKIGIQVYHTPGHSLGECCYWVPGDPPYLLSGDTVFIRDCGRTDLPTGSTRQMFDSLQRIKKLPKNTILLPGHHYRAESSSTLAQELKTSPPFLCQSVEELEALP
ncbi:MAG: MBL fold metallo-hydrolase [Bdellovibrionia bacterium]